MAVRDAVAAWTCVQCRFLQAWALGDMPMPADVGYVLRLERLERRLEQHPPPLVCAPSLQQLPSRHDFAKVLAKKRAAEQAGHAEGSPGSAAPVGTG